MYYFQLNEEFFREVVISLGFKEDLVETIYNEYLSCRSLLHQVLPQTSLTYPQFSNLEWRFEAQVRPPYEEYTTGHKQRNHTENLSNLLTGILKKYKEWDHSSNSDEAGTGKMQ